MTHRNPDDQQRDELLRQHADEANRAMSDGDARRAADAAARVIDLLERAGAAPDEGVLGWWAFRANALLEADRFDEALVELRRVLARRTALSGPDARATLRVRADIVDAHRRAGRHTEALGLARGLLDDRRRVHGDDDPQTRRARQVVHELEAPADGDT